MYIDILLKGLFWPSGIGRVAEGRVDPILFHFFFIESYILYGNETWVGYRLVREIHNIA